MFRLEVVNELYLKATCLDGRGELFTKAGAWVAGSSTGYKFDKVLLGPQGNPIAGALGQIGRRLTGENLPLMKVSANGQSETYYSFLAQHVTVINLPIGTKIVLESENILAFCGCKYGVDFFGKGVVSGGGLFKSTLIGQEEGASVAIITEGNPMVFDTPFKVDPDAYIAHIGGNPKITFDVGWKNLIGQASGESYQFDFNQPGGKVIIQPSERESGIDIGIDGKGGKPDVQDNNLFRQDGNQMLQGSSGGLKGMIGNILNS